MLSQSKKSIFGPANTFGIGFVKKYAANNPLR